MTEKTFVFPQLEAWSSIEAPACLEQVSGELPSTKIGTNYFKTPLPYPWRPAMTREMIKINTLPEISVTNQHMAKKCSPEGMLTAPLVFPNLVTGYDRNPQNAAKAALYTRYTYPEWLKNMRCLYSEGDTTREQSEALRSRILSLMEETDDVKGQTESGRQLEERISELKSRCGEASEELEKLLNFNRSSIELLSTIQKVIQDLEGPLHIAQECLYHREARKGTELAHDDVEKCLLFEVENLRNCQKKLQEMLERLTLKFKDTRATQAMLEEDVTYKEGALGIDRACHQLCNYSPGVNYYGGIENYDPTITTAETWKEASAFRVCRSQNERENGEKLHKEANDLINEVTYLVLDAWNGTNDAISKRSTEQTEARCEVLSQLQKTQKELFTLDMYLDKTRKAIQDKATALKVAQTRHEARSHRNGIELCKDAAHLRLVQEIQDLQQAFTDLDMKLQETEALQQQFLKTRTNLENALKYKTDALFIDCEKCMGLRRSFPVKDIIKYCKTNEDVQNF